MKLSFSTWNILANRFTNYNMGQKENEDKVQMKNRYLSIIIILQNLQKDIYFLQEVDNHFYYLLQSSELQNNYFISFRYHKSWIQEKNKDDIGILMMIKKKLQWKVDTSLNQRLLDKMDSLQQPLLQSRKQTYEAFQVIMFAMLVAGLAMLGYQMYTMINLMNKMTLNTFAMCNMTKSITETPTTCYL